ncbi:MAG: branched-chain amino acid ABC transporter substrate-binding protein [Betaproteobacteria bacterium]|nr:MAG: branched-chain amino acid ABC transporter substrate-binding protein [Betaproteobacteria bacterium]
MNWRISMILLGRIASIALALAFAHGPAAAQGSYKDPGITDTQIKLGGSYPFSGPGSAYGAVYDGVKAYFDLVNSRGGVKGRKIESIVLDDAYQPSKVVANVRQLVEQDKVFAIFNIGGTAHNLAVADYILRNKIPHLYLNTGAIVFAQDRKKFPYTLIGIPAYATESAAFAQYIKQEKPNAKVAVLYQNDPFGQDLLEPFEAAAKRQGVHIVAKEPYNATEPSVDSQVSKLARSGADVFVSFTIPKFAAQAIRKAAELNWKPMQLLTSVSASTELVLKPAGLAGSQGIISTAFLKDPSDPASASDPAVKEYVAALKQFVPNANPADPLRARGYALAQVMVKALEGMKAPSREALMQSALNMDTEIPMLLPGIRIQTSPTDALPMKALYMERFQGERWVVLGKPLSPSLK